MNANIFTLNKIQLASKTKQNAAEERRNYSLLLSHMLYLQKCKIRSIQPSNISCTTFSPTAICNLKLEKNLHKAE